MKAIVTGGTGFVGNPFVRRILRDGWHVTLVTRDKKKATPLTHENLTIYEANVSDDRAIEQIAQKEDRFDAIFHLAASLNYFGDKEELYKTNVQGTRNILSLAVRTSAKKFIYASSIEAVGTVTRKEVPAPIDKACKPISPYGETKALAEQQVMKVASDHFPAIILRIGNVYGPDHFNLVTEIAQAILTHNKLLKFLPVYADRYIHPIHNEDVTEGILAAYRSDAPSSIITLAGEYATVGELFQICAEVLGKQIQYRQKKKADEVYLLLRREYHKYHKRADFITYLMAGPGKRVHRAYSIEETSKVLDFFPKIDLTNGIEKTLLKWAKETLALNHPS